MPTYSFEEEVDALATAGLLTERQARAYVHREVELTPRRAAAEDMGITVSTLDDYRREAVGKVETAEATAEALDTIRNQV